MSLIPLDASILQTEVFGLALRLFYLDILTKVVHELLM